MPVRWGDSPAWAQAPALAVGAWLKAKGLPEPRKLLGGEGCVGRRGVFQGPGVRHGRDSRLGNGGLCGGHVRGELCPGKFRALGSLSLEEEINLASVGAA